MTTLVEDLIWLIDTPSVTGEEEQLCNAVARRLSGRYGPDGIARIGNSLVVGHLTGKPQITLYGHLDTVPAQGNTTGLILTELKVPFPNCPRELSPAPYLQ